MLSNEDIYNGVSLIYQKNRLRAEQIRQQHFDEVYKKIPRIAEIDEELKNSSLVMARLALSAGGRDACKKSMSEYTAAVEVLIEEKNRLLHENGYPQDYFEPVYACPVCRDTGNNGTKKCECFKRNLDQFIAEQHYKLSGVRDILYKENFDTFDLNVYSKKVPVDKKLSPYDNAAEILDEVKETVGKTDKQHPCNLIFSGQTGVGKTFLCNCAAKALIDKGLSLHYVSAFHLFKEVADSYFNRNGDRFNMDTITRSDVLVIDDLGAEVKSSVTKACFLDIINQRVRNGGSTLISTNYSIAQLFETYEERIGSRFAQHYKLYNLYGEDIRMI